MLLKIGNFGEKGKPVALLFGKKRALLKIGNFGEKGKPIALLFGKKNEYFCK